jgi:hypothetical protein
MNLLDLQERSERIAQLLGFPAPIPVCSWHRICGIYSIYVPSEDLYYIRQEALLIVQTAVA